MGNRAKLPDPGQPDELLRVDFKAVGVWLHPDGHQHVILQMSNGQFAHCGDADPEVLALWRAHLDGRITFREAIATLVGRISETKDGDRLRDAIKKEAVGVGSA